MTCPVEEELGAYVLRALELEEAEAVADHLGTCRTCRDEARSLGATAGLLALLQPEDFEELEALDAQTRGRRPARRGVRAAAASAALVGAALSTALVTGLGHLQPSGSHAGQEVVQAVDPVTRMQAEVTMSRQQSGTMLRLTLTGADPHGWCSLVARARDGRTDTAASWWANAQGDATVDGTTGFRADQLTELDVVTHSGRLLLRIPVPRAASTSHGSEAGSTYPDVTPGRHTSSRLESASATSADRKEPMNLALWIVTAVLALVLLLASSKMFVPRETMATMVGKASAWVEDFDPWVLKGIGLLELLGALGLVLPGVLDVAPALVPVTGGCVVVLFLGAVTMRLRRGERITVLGDLVYLAMAVFVTWGRIWPSPL